MQTGEKTFTADQIQRLVYHPPCTACQNKPGHREFVCRACEMNGFKWKKPEIVFRKAPSNDMIDALNITGGTGSDYEDRRRKVEPARGRRRARPDALLYQIVQLLPGQVETFPKIDKEGRRRGTGSRTRYLSNSEIAEQVGCTPQYVGKVRDWLCTDNRSSVDDFNNPGWYVHDSERSIRTEFKDCLPSREAALALYLQRQPRPPSPAQQIVDARYRQAFRKLIAHSSRYFRTGGGGTNRG
jgi:hypothetical protein